MRRLWGSSALVVAVASATPTAAQTLPDQTPPQRSPSDQAPSPQAPAQPTADQLGITVTAKRLDEARGSIQPSLGASRYDFTPSAIDTVPNGDKAPINQVLLRAPGVAQDSFGQIHVRGDHANVQYRLDGVQLPEGMSLFTNALTTQYASKMSLIDGALPAQYGFRTAGVIDIALKSGRSDPGAETSMTVGSYAWQQPSFGGNVGASPTIAFESSLPLALPYMTRFTVVMPALSRAQRHP